VREVLGDLLEREAIAAIAKKLRPRVLEPRARLGVAVLRHVGDQRLAGVVAAGEQQHGGHQVFHPETIASRGPCCKSPWYATRMARQDRLAADLDRGFAALEEGRLDDAAKCVERLRQVDRNAPDVVALAAAVAEASGETDEALAQYRVLVELRPDDPMPRIGLARLVLDAGDADAALEIVDKAFDFIDDESDLIEAVIVRVTALLAIDDLEEARAALSELSTSVIEDGELALDLAELALGAEDPSAAVRWIEIGRRQDGLAADALHLLGRVHEARDERLQMIAAWQEVRALDAAAPPGTVAIAEDEVERIAERTLAELPANVRTKLERVPILIEDLPSEELVADGIDPRLLGLFSGTPMPEDGALAPSVTNIRLFRRNLERVSRDLDELAAEVRITVLHETAHYFGLEEDDLERLGLD
jgi:predicted Zn-dependent protease with MMP-like domain/Flp pilus assembly protein TadD